LDAKEVRHMGAILSALLSEEWRWKGNGCENLKFLNACYWFGAQMAMFILSGASSSKFKLVRLYGLFGT
jgi:hypothetical protein